MFSKGINRFLSVHCRSFRSYHSTRNTAWLQPSPRGSYVKNKYSNNDKKLTSVVLIATCDKNVIGSFVIGSNDTIGIDNILKKKSL